MPIRPFEPPPGDGRGFSDRTAAERPSLPDTHTARWVAGRKRQILRALDEGLITLAEVCRRYELTAEEIAEWRHRFRRHGTPGLKVTKLGELRRRDRESQTRDAAASAGAATPPPRPEAE